MCSDKICFNKLLINTRKWDNGQKTELTRQNILNENDLIEIAAKLSNVQAH
jgi:hypothetical protein